MCSTDFISLHILYIFLTRSGSASLHISTMNTSRPVEYFFLEGLKDRYVLPIFYTVYVFVLSGNSMIIYLVRNDPKLNTPLYFFLHNLSFSDIVYTSVTIPKMLSVFLTEIKTISKTGCFLQMYFFLSTGATGRALLTVMAFDRYIAICNPLWYTTIMTTQLCILMIFASWGFGAFMVLPTTIWATQLPYCGPNIVRHMFCDYSSVVSLACIDTTGNGVLSLKNALIAFLRTFLIILISHVCIGKAMRKMSMAQQLKDAATCVSHLTVVFISYISASFVYISYRVARFDPDVRIVIAVLYSVLTPLLNPIIYSLRNTELQDAMKRAFCKCTIASKTTSKTVSSVA
ncbi:LOW QUALITY PROTEIN: olfactory receptor 6N1-like [Sinocyclocheilus rhinocerous]|uniref:LOW QUALITY PROTEIN: olfactory receptor 6N1-like n=1 Tax=Sinocyclocheilus rhinocerous TaxID=307959 RepID=UPI0007BA4DE5|nr:PREDICTED: LOW QUALITY PROTEIN: olfactory receptor 6N1-like [Sinocyclocheilus rhinocerous]